MITEGWFIREVLGKRFVPNSEVCSQSPKVDWEQNCGTKNLMDKGFQEYVPIVPTVPTENESPYDLVEVGDGTTQGDEITVDLGSHVRLVVSLPHAMTETDDRVLCGDCLHLSRGGQCYRWSIVNPHNRRYQPVPDVLRRCGSHKPRTAD